MNWRRLWDGQRFRTIDGGNFSIRLYTPHGLRYIENGRELTLVAETVDESDKHGKRFFFLPTIAREVRLPSVLSWDDGVQMDDTEVATVIERIRQSLDRIKTPYRIIVDDEIYKQMQEAVDKVEGEFGR